MSSYTYYKIRCVNGDFWATTTEDTTIDEEFDTLEEVKDAVGVFLVDTKDAVIPYTHEDIEVVEFQVIESLVPLQGIL